MERRNFIRNVFVGSSVLTLGLSEVINSLIPQEDIILPFLDGEHKVTIYKNKFHFIQKTYAQQYMDYYGYNYGHLAPYGQWIAYQQAYNAWYQQMQMWYQQQHFSWLQSQHIQRMQQIMAMYQSGYQMGGNPQVMDYVQSIYGFAYGRGGLIFFGMNADRQHVGTQKTVKGASAMYDGIKSYYQSEEKAQGNVLPQSTERGATITLPNGSTLAGNGYRTTNGSFGVSTDVVTDNTTGKTGQVAKFKTAEDGEKYMVI